MDHQHDLRGGVKDSSRSKKMEVLSQGPMFQRERRGISQVSHVQKLVKRLHFFVSVKLLFLMLRGIVCLILAAATANCKRALPPYVVSRANPLCSAGAALPKKKTLPRNSDTTS